MVEKDQYSVPYLTKSIRLTDSEARILYQNVLFDRLTPADSDVSTVVRLEQTETLAVVEFPVKAVEEVEKLCEDTVSM